MGLPSGRGPVEKCIQDKLYNRKVWKIFLFLVLLIRIKYAKFNL